MAKNEVAKTGPVERKPLHESLKSYMEAKARKKLERAERRLARARGKA
jgi:hypothetical protein